MDRFIARDVVGPALVIGANDTCVITANDDAAIMEIVFYKYEDSEFEGN